MPYLSPIQQFEANDLISRSGIPRSLHEIESRSIYFHNLRNSNWREFDGNAVKYFAHAYLRGGRRTLRGLLSYVIKNRPRPGQPRSPNIRRVEKFLFDYWRSPFVQEQLNWDHT